jgi:hypothetical protein
MLPPPRRRRTAPPLKPVNSYMFTGLHPLYRREVIQDQHDHMTIYCNQTGCTNFKPRVVNRTLSGTNNYKPHYKKYHPDIPTSVEEEQRMQRVQQDKANKQFYKKPEEEQSHNERFRTLLLEFITKNNLSFRIVDQAETKALITFLSPQTKQVSKTTLMKDLKTRYESAEEVVHRKLQKHINLGGRIALTTDEWAGNNKLDYIAVTAHFTTRDGVKENLLLDIIELTDPVHSGEVLCAKLLEVTDRLCITCAIISVTRDNAKPNDTMLDNFEAEVENQYDLMEERDQAYFCCKFNRKEGDVRCCAHIYNIAVQAGQFKPLLKPSIITN